MLTTPRVLLVAVLVGAAISLTAIDKYDESICLDSRSSPTIEVYTEAESGYLGGRGRNYAGPRGGGTSSGGYGCDGFLPW